MIRSSFNGFKHQPIAKTYQFVSTPTCLRCQGTTIDINGAQCRACKGAGFLTYRGAQGVGRAMEKR